MEALAEDTTIWVQAARPVVLVVFLARLGGVDVDHFGALLRGAGELIHQTGFAF